MKFNTRNLLPPLSNINTEIPSSLTDSLGFNNIPELLKFRNIGEWNNFKNKAVQDDTVIGAMDGALVGAPSFIPASIIGSFGANSISNSSVSLVFGGSYYPLEFLATIPGSLTSLIPFDSFGGSTLLSIASLPFAATIPPLSFFNFSLLPLQSISSLALLGSYFVGVIPGLVSFEPIRYDFVLLSSIFINITIDTLVGIIPVTIGGLIGGLAGNDSGNKLTPERIIKQKHPKKNKGKAKSKNKLPKKASHKAKRK